MPVDTTRGPNRYQELEIAEPVTGQPPLERGYFDNLPDMSAPIGFISAWVIGAVVMALVINTIRAKDGANLNDPTTAFLEGVILGPIGILSGLDPKQRALGRGTPRIVGGVVGSLAAYGVYQAL